MRKTHYLIVGILSLISISTHAIDSQKIAAKHPIIADKPVPGFFEGALLGNGALGVVVTTRPDAVCLHFGHNNVWDIRIAENNKEKIGTFDEIFTKAQTTLTGLPSIYHSNEFSEYLKLTAENYHKPYPRPFPCGTLLLGFDRREVELLGHTLDISNGLCTVQLLKNGKKIALRIFTDMNKDRVWLSLTDDHGNSISSCFNRIRLIADPSTPNDIPHYQIREQEKSLGYFQRLPYLEPHLYDIQKGHAKDKAFTLDLATNVSLLKGQRTTTLGIKEDLADMERYLDTSETPFYAMVSLKEGLAEDTSLFTLPKEKITANSYIAAEKASMQKWSEYWKCSGVSLADNDLEKIWYRNLYFLNCSAKAGVTCPGIFANWSYGNIGTAWHGDYHLNYNTQQPFWVTYSSNHLDKNIPYVDLVHHLLPVSRAWAKEYYNMRRALKKSLTWAML
ncbi:glycoside hydrolase N-terminal domain-containing protein [Bacteroides sp.]|uniref:glycoside hydrolase N-terminal domain-containing protein n=1 Tax=Bacteroides sp. TaxID=29523 RepID=UPI0025BCC74C|nr:glycoside hydrolase N-terminal domain-containing protein [Bacteroides sp.]